MQPSRSPLRYRARERMSDVGIRRLLAHLRSNADRPVTLDDMAAIACVSRYHLVRVFRQATGQTPRAYLTRLRVVRAVALMASGESASRASHACGFADQSHMTRAFVRIVGLTPGRVADHLTPRVPSDDCLATEPTQRR